MKKSIVVNLFAGPGAGKSTGATYIFSKLKMLGIDAEYVSEFAKDKVWEENERVFHSQFYITGKQSWKILRCNGKVDVIITDSPILLGAMYSDDNPLLIPAIKYEFDKYDNVNLFIQRAKKYNPNGRNQTENEAKEIDDKIIDFLNANNVRYRTIFGNEEGYNVAIEYILERIKEIELR
jgi:hypothetical protein